MKKRKDKQRNTSEETLKKYKELGEILSDMRKRFCGVGTRIAKLIMNTDETMPGVAYRLALEIEDVNIQAKQVGNKRSAALYRRKEKMIAQLYEMCKTYGYVAGSHKRGSTAKSIVYFELPGCEQISWHTVPQNAACMDDYPVVWDGKVNSTMGKLEGAICKLYGDRFLKSAEKNRIPGAREYILRIYEKHNAGMHDFETWKSCRSEMYEKAVRASGECTRRFVESTLHKKISPFFKDPSKLALHVATRDLDGNAKYRVSYNGKRLEAKFKNTGESPDTDAAFKSIMGIVRTADPKTLAGNGVETARTIADTLLSANGMWDYKVEFYFDENRPKHITPRSEKCVVVFNPDGRWLVRSLEENMHAKNLVEYGCVAAVTAARFDRIWNRRLKNYSGSKEDYIEKHTVKNQK